MGAQVVELLSPGVQRRRPTFDDVIAAAVDEAVARRDDGTCLLLSEVAERLKVSPNRITAWHKAGELRLVTFGSSKRVRLVDLVAFLDRHSS